MSASLFKITPTPPTSIKLDPGQEGKLSFTVESLAAPDKVHAIMLQAQLVGEGGKGKEVDWLVVGPERTLTMSGGKTETVTITARPTPTSPRGEHRLKLVIADRDRPNDVYAGSPPVACEVSTPLERPTPARKVPWWLIAAIVGGLVVVVGGVLVVWKLAGKDAGGPAGLGDPCGRDAAGACEQGLVCVAGVDKCLLAGGATCTPARADQCASGECSTAEICAIPLGGACDPGDQDLVPCPRNSACDPATRTCLGNVGATCKVDTECVTGSCAGNVCAIKGPALAPGDPCEGTCPAPLQCSATSKRCVEPMGRPCSDNNQCATGLCAEGLCARPELLRDCTRDGICGVDQKCIEFQPGLNRCVWKPGHACTSSAECSSRWCNGGICTRDDGRCQSQSDCPSPYLCITGKQKCLIPNGQLCGGDAQCDSSFCRSNRCAPSPCVPACTGLYHCNNDLANPRCILSIPVKVIEGLSVPAVRHVPWKQPLGVR